MKTVFINYSQQAQIISIIKLDASFVDMANYLIKDKLGVLIQFTLNQTISILNLTDVTPYVLLFFDDELNFKGASGSIKNDTGLFTLQAQYKNILFLRIPHNLKLNEIINLSYE